MNYLPKFLAAVKQDVGLMHNQEVNFVLGLMTTQVKELKRVALAEGFVEDKKRELYLTPKAELYLGKNPVGSWVSFEYEKRPDVNLEYLKFEKAPPTLTKAIRLLARHLIEGEVLKENSTEHYLVRELLCSKSAFITIKQDIEQFLLGDEKIKLTDLFDKFMAKPYGLTKSVTAVLLLDVLVKNKDIIAVYENLQFQLRVDHLMFDRMIYCPKNFELQKTIFDGFDVLEEVSEIVLPCRSKNILDITKGLIYFIRNLDKYTLSTERLKCEVFRFRNVVMNAKDPISLFYRDIPKILTGNILCQSDKKLVSAFDNAVQELQDCYSNLIKEITKFFFDSFDECSRVKLVERFDAVQEYLGDSELKILMNNINNHDSTDRLWIERIATFVNKSRVPKDWSDADVADFKVKVKELSFKFQAIESTVGKGDVKLDTPTLKLLEQLLILPKAQQITILRKAYIAK